jgi:beta-lactamase regulating signal transducer with metallopeptidase domain
LAWTLVHSVWQSFFCAAIVFVALRILHPRNANLRYWIATGGLVLIIVTSVGTFFHLSQRLEIANATVTSLTLHSTVAYQPSVAPPAPYDSFFSTVGSWIDVNTGWIVLLWGIGAFVFSARTIGGWWYLRRLQQDAHTPDDMWVTRVSSLAHKMGITRLVRILETTRIQAPIVIGFIKPVILIPVGMMSGLSTAQLESIVIHELMHIRRADYLVNLLQSVLEGIYFFNPFVWVISGLIRNERENCCDDAVVRMQGDPMAYARALASLEEIRLTRTGFAPALADNNKQLLNRIRRIMEKSAKQYSSRDRIIPLLLLAIGLFCASWVSIQTGKSSDSQVNPSASQSTVADTTVRTKKSGRYYRERTVTDIDGDVVEEITASFEGDEELRPLLQELEVVAPVAPPAQLPSMQMIMPPFHTQELLPDSLPPIPWGHGDWERFGREFEQTFENNFQEFYQENQEKIREMINKIESSFGQEFQHDLAMKMQRLAETQTAMALDRVEHLKINELALVQQHASLERLQEQMGRFEELNMANLERLEAQARVFSESLEKMEAELQEQLVKDGYLTPGEKLDGIRQTDGKLEINGKKIKPEDLERYQDILRKYEFGKYFHHMPGGKMD